MTSTNKESPVAVRPIIDALIEQARNRVAPTNCDDIGGFIANHRSVGLMVGRHNGIQNFLADWIGEFGQETLVLFHNARHREQFRMEVLEPKNGANTRHTSLRAEHIRAFIAKDVDRFKGQAERVKEIKHRIRYIVILDSTAMFAYNGVRRFGFSQWAGETFGLDVMTVHLN